MIIATSRNGLGLRDSALLTLRSGTSKGTLHRLLTTVPDGGSMLVWDG